MSLRKNDVLLLLLGFCAVHGLHGQNSHWKTFSTLNSGLPNESVKCIEADHEGNIWVGTYLNGIGVYSDRGWLGYNTDNSDLPHNYINCISVDRNNRIWAGTDGGGLAMFDGSAWKVFNSKNSGLPSDVIMDIVCSADGSVWIGTYFDGLVKYKDDKWIKFNTENSDLLSNKVISLAIDTNDVVWIGTHGGGLVSYNNVNWRVFNQRNSKIPNDYIYSIAIDENNNKWIGTGGGGIALYNDIFWEIFDTGTSGLTDNNIRPLVTGANNFIWAGTYLGGLAGFSGFEWFTFHAGNSPIPDDEINCLLYTADSTLWIGTERNGIVIMKDTLSFKIAIPEDLTEVETPKTIIFNTSIPPLDNNQDKDNNVIPTKIDDYHVQSRIFIVLDIADFHADKALRRLYLRSLKTLLYKRETLGVDYGVYFTIFSSNSRVKPGSFTLSAREKELFFVKSLYCLDSVNNYQNALSAAYRLLTEDFIPEGNNQVIAATYYDIKGNEETIKELIRYNLEENYITFSLLSFGPISWKDEHKLRNLIPRGGGQYYKIEPVEILHNWSATFQIGTSIFRGDMDVTKPVSFPGEFGFAMNKKVVSNGLLNGGVKGQFNFGEFSGKKRDYSFENNYKEACVNFQVILNSWINRNYKFEKIRPYAFGGIGLINYRSLLRDGEGTIIKGYGYEIPETGSNGNGHKPEKKSAMTELIFPLGLGMNYKLNDLFSLEAEFSSRYINSDKLDSWIAMKDDKYFFFSVGVTYKFEEKEFLSNILNK
ncbi:MAG: outer membrane beta-barrel protein [Bacteroidales bacterium]|nr:outer membrane beta-barrel protein [Bacteroidales bacterium]